MKINATSFPAAKFANIGSVVNLIVPIIMGLAAFVFLIMLIQAAFTIITGEGKPEAFSKAMKILSFSIIGLVIVLSAYMIVKLIGIVLKVPVPL